MTKEKRLLTIIKLLAIWGALEVLFFWSDSGSDAAFMIANLAFHVPVIAGFIWLTRKGSPKFRTNWFWTPLGLLMILWPTLTVVLTNLMDPDQNLLAIFSLSETLWYGWAFGLLFGFFSLKSLGKFWYFFTPLSIGWSMWLVTILLQAFNLPTITLGGGAPLLETYFLSGNFWDDWGWFLADMMVDIPLALTPLVMIVSNIVKTVRKR